MPSYSASYNAADLRVHMGSDGNVQFAMWVDGKAISTWQMTPDKAIDFANNLLDTARGAAHGHEKTDAPDCGSRLCRCSGTQPEA